MSCLTYCSGTSPIHRLDPRVRLISATWLVFSTALLERPVALIGSLALGALLAALARLKVRALSHRLGHLNALMLFLWLVLPWSVPGSPQDQGFGVACSREGVRLALTVTLKANAMVLFFTALVATIAPQHLPAALARLGIPGKAVHLLALTVRYTDWIHERYSQLRRTLRIRAFEPQFSWHTLRTCGYLVGLLLVQGLDRAERVLAAMQCRGFDGQYRTLEAWTFGYAETAFVLLTALAQLPWLWVGRL